MKSLSSFVLSLFLMLVVIGGADAAPSTNQLKSRVKQLGQSAANGNLEAVDRLAEIAVDLRKKPGSDSASALRANRELLEPAFDAMAKAVGRGNAKAFDALTYALGKSYIQGIAASSLGELAANGHKAALATLLDYKANGILLSTATISLQRAAEKNIPEAVEFMIDIIESGKSKALWRLAANGLRSAAAKGNQRAKAAIKKYEEG